jgi:hypothetical protein
MYQKILTKILGIFDIPSGCIIGLWSLVMLIGSAYSIYKTHEISTGVAMMFSTVITGFAGHKIAKVWKGTDSSTDNNDTNLDVQGDKNEDDTVKPTK